MRFVLVSTHIDQTTGYAKVAYNILKQLATLSPKVKVYHYGFQRHPGRLSIRKYPEGVISYDASANEDPKEEGFGFNKIHEYLEMVNPDIVMLYNDPLIIYRFIESMKIEKTKPYKVWTYVDQVYDAIAPPLVDKIREVSDRVYCFTDIWKKKFLEYGEHPDVRILGHAVDPAVFTSMSQESRLAARKNLNIPENALLFLNANRNSQRKRLDLTVAGFVKLLAQRPNDPIYLMMITNVLVQSGAYYDLQRIFMEELKANKLEVSYLQRFILVDSASQNIIPDDGINNLYNIADIGVNTSDGEGYGLCQLEHMYTGAPQVVTDIGSYRSFLDETVAEFVSPGDRVYFGGSMPLGGYTFSFSSKDVASALGRAVDSLKQKKAAVESYRFKSWSTICDELLEDVLTLASSPAATLSA